MSESTPRFHGFYRWYDQDLHVSELVRLLEQMSPGAQLLFALLLNHLCEVLMEGKDQARIDWPHIMGLIKSKKARRWYDMEPTMHRAFNMLYSLGETEQTLAAQELYLPAMLTGHYEEFSKKHGREPDLDAICDLVEIVFKAGPEAAQEKLSQLEKAT